MVLPKEVLMGLGLPIKILKILDKIALPQIQQLWVTQLTKSTPTIKSTLILYSLILLVNQKKNMKVLL